MGLAGTADRPLMLGPSAAQRERFERGDPSRPLALLVRSGKPGSVPGYSPAWAAREVQVFVGPLEKFEHVALYEFANRKAAAEFVEALVASPCGPLHIDVLTAQPRRIALLTRVLAFLLPKLPFDNSVDETEEPGVGTSSVMPTREAIAEIRAHPAQDRPIVMVNWLKFRPDGGRAAYYRYGKVALVTTHSIGAKLLQAGRYLQCLVGNGGDPAPQRWDELALMQYPGRAAFAYMASLKRYRRGLADREAGLAEHGQGLLVTEPAAEFVWRA